MPQARFHTDLSLPYWLVRERDTSINVSIFDATTGEAATVTSAVVSLLKPDGTAVVDEIAAVVSATNLVTYTVLATAVPATEALSAIWVVRWGVTIGGIVYDFESLAHVARREPLAPVIVTDLHARHQTLVTLKTRTKTNRQLLAESITVTWETVLRRIIHAGRDPERIMSLHNLYDLVIWGAMGHAFLDAASSLNSGGQLGELGAFYDKKFEKAWNSLKLDYDANGDGQIAVEEQRRSGVPVLMVGVKRWRG